MEMREFIPRGPTRELTRLIRQMKGLTLELKALRQRGGGDRELRAKERALERLRWRLAAVARRAATDDRRGAG